MKETSNIFKNLLLKIEKGKIEISDEERTKAVQSIINFLLRGYEEYYNISLDNETKKAQTKKLLDDLVEQVNSFINKKVLPIVTLSTLTSVQQSFRDASLILEPQTINQEENNSKHLAKEEVKKFSDSIISRIDDTLKLRKRDNYDRYIKELLNTSFDINDSNRSNNVNLIVDVLKDYVEDYYSSKQENRQETDEKLKHAIDKLGECIDLILKTNNSSLIQKTLNSFEVVRKKLSDNVTRKENYPKDTTRIGTLTIVDSVLERINNYIQEESLKKANYAIQRDNIQQTINNEGLRRPMGVPEVAWKAWSDEEKLAYSNIPQIQEPQKMRQEKNSQEMSLTTKKEGNKFFETIKNIGRKVKQTFETFRSKKTNNSNQYQQSSVMQNRKQTISSEQEQWYFGGTAPLEKTDETIWVRVRPPREPEMPQHTRREPARAPIMPELYPEMQQHNSNPVINDWHPQEQFRKSLFIPPEELGVDPRLPNNTWHKINGKTYIKREEGMVEVLGKDLE